MWPFLHGCTSVLWSSDSIFRTFQFFSKALIRPAWDLPPGIVRYCFISFLKNWLDSIHDIVPCYLTSFLALTGLLFRDLLRSFFWLLILVLCPSLSCSASDKLYLNVRSTFAIVCWRNKYRWVFFPDKSRQEKMAFLGSPVRLTSRRPPPLLPQSLCGWRSFGRSLVRWRHNQIFLAWWVINFAY